LWGCKPLECARWAGRMKNASTSEKIKTAMTTRARFQIKLPKIPSRKKKGVKARMVVVTEVKTGPTISLVPSIAD